MKRADLEHVIAAAATISGDDEIIVVGSQAMLATYPEAPGALLQSVEADLYPRNRPDLAEASTGRSGSSASSTTRMATTPTASRPRPSLHPSAGKSGW